MELENWVDLGQPGTETDAHEQFVSENKIIDVHPRKGSLAPGATCMRSHAPRSAPERLDHEMPS